VVPCSAAGIVVVRRVVISAVVAGASGDCSAAEC
jgi:hypothetical protein